MTPILFSVFTAPEGRTLGKTVAWQDGKLVKSLQGSVSGGSVRKASAKSLSDFISQAAALTEHDGIALGVCEYEQATVLSRQQLSSGNRQGNFVARTRDSFGWAEGPGVLFLDYDPRPGSVPLQGNELVSLLRKAVPAFASATLVHKASSSSFLVAPDGSQISGLGGQHLFSLVRDARLIPELAQRIVDRLWLAGHGRYDVSASGKLLAKTLFDVSVWQPERLIFTRAGCFDGISQELPPPTVFAGACDEIFEAEFPLNDALVAGLTSDELQRLAAIKSEATASVLEDARTAREGWLNNRIGEAIARPTGPSDGEQLRDSMRAALEEGYLPADLILSAEHGEQVSVRELLTDPGRWHLRRFADPIEPDYRGDKRIAIALLSDRKVPAIFSHAHGGILYPLISAPQSTPEDFDDLTTRRDDQRRFGLVSAAEFARMSPPEWIIKDVLPASALAMVYGASGSGKSFIMLDILWAIAAGEPWAEHRTKRLRVIYVAAEGRAGLRLRLRAFEKARGTSLSDLPFNILPDTPDLRSADAELLIDAIEANGGADVIVIDTLAQATSGADENSGQDMGPVLAKCSAMIERLGATVVLVHHSGKDASRGSRGWSGIKGALDTELHVVRHETHSSISVTKQKDGPEGKTISFELQPVELGFDAEGDPVVSRTVRHLNAAEVSKDDPKGKWQTRIYDELLALEGFGSVQRESLLAAVIIRQAADYPNEQPVRKDALLRSLRKLITRGTVVLQDGCVSSTSTTKTHNR